MHAQTGVMQTEHHTLGSTTVLGMHLRMLKKRLPLQFEAASVSHPPSPHGQPSFNCRTIDVLQAIMHLHGDASTRADVSQATAPVVTLICP